MADPVADNEIMGVETQAAPVAQPSAASESGLSSVMESDQPLDALWDLVAQLSAQFGFKILGALAILLIGWVIAKWVRRIIYKVLRKTESIDNSLARFGATLGYSLSWIFVLLAVLSSLGVQIASFIAILGAAGLAVGLALQGSLSNLASGILIIFLRPFKAGDYIEAGGYEGTVEEIDILTTSMITLDNKLVIVPNSAVTGGTVINWSRKGQRRMDFVFGVSYGSDVDHVKRVLMEEVKKNELFLQDPAPFVGLLEMADSSVNFACRPWIDPDQYWDAYFQLNEAVKKRFDAEGIEIPFPQRVVHSVSDD